MSHELAPSRSSCDRSWVAVLVLIALSLAPAASTLVAIRAVSRRDPPSDERLVDNLLAREAEFDELLHMLEADLGGSRPGAGEFVDLAGLSAVVANSSRMKNYERLLRQISVTDLHYFAASGDLILLPDVAPIDVERYSKSYAYFAAGRPQGVVAHQGYDRRGPGVYLLTGDRPVRGRWFIHYDAAIAIAFSPY